MENTIIFPNLHITLENVGQSISIGGFQIAYYGIVIAIGMVLGSALILAEAKRTGQSEDSYLDIILWTLVFAVIGARTYYVVFAWDYYKDNPVSVFNIRQGGLAIYGGILAGILTVIIVARIKKMKVLRVLDTCILGVPVGQILGRWGNFFNREAFGQYTNNLFAMQIPLDRVRSSSDVTEEMYEHIVNIGGTDFISVHPTFLYESLWNIGVLLIMFLLRKHIKFYGQQILTYLTLYGIGRFWIESLRTDQLIFFGTGIPVSMMVAVILVAFGVCGMVVGLIRSKKHPIPTEGEKKELPEEEEMPLEYEGTITVEQAIKESETKK